jgi:hypothetical protein
MERTRRGGLLLRVDGGFRFIPASAALKIAPAPRVTSVPGAPPELVGIALHEGAIVPVVAIGPLRGTMVVCHHAGELLALIGGEVVRTGLFDAVPDQQDAVVHAGEIAPALDLAALYERIQAKARVVSRVRDSLREPPDS